MVINKSSKILAQLSGEDKGAAIGPCAVAGTSGVVSKAKQKIRKFRIRANGYFQPAHSQIAEPSKKSLEAPR